MEIHVDFFRLEAERLEARAVEQRFRSSQR
jgi:hypothetical protein